MLHVDLTTGKPARTAANALTQETLALVDDFYHNDDVSNIMPGKADTISIMKDGVRTTLQKRHMTMTIGEAYALFQEDHHPDLLRKSKFAELRPKDVLLVSKYPQNVCGCRYHTNMCLLLSALNKKLPQIFPVYSRAEFLAQCACNLESQECMIGDCEACCDGKLLAENFTNKIPPAILKDQIKYHKWTSGARVEKEQITSSVEEACKTLAGDLTAFRWHSFVKTHQENSYKLDKSVAQAPDSKVLCLQMDFSENFSIQQQNEIQSAHWHHDQLTVYTIMMWHRQSKLPWVIISDNLSHDKFAVTAFLKVILDEIKSSESFKEVQEVRVWTDGPSSQYKNRYIFYLLQQIRPLLEPITLVWNFFATSHGKGPCDGLGGTVKRIVQRKIRTGAEVRSAQDFCQAVNANIKVSEISSEETHQICSTLGIEPKWNRLMPISGTMNAHFVKSIGEMEILLKYFTSAEDDIQIKKMKMKPYPAQQTEERETVQAEQRHLEQRQAGQGQERETVQAEQRQLEQRQAGQGDEREILQAEQRQAGQGDEREILQAEQRRLEQRQAGQGEEREILQAEQRELEQRQAGQGKEREILQAEQRQLEQRQTGQGEEREILQAEQRQLEQRQAGQGEEREILQAEQRQLEQRQAGQGEEREILQAEQRRLEQRQAGQGEERETVQAEQRQLEQRQAGQGEEREILQAEQRQLEQRQAGQGEERETVQAEQRQLEQRQAGQGEEREILQAEQRQLEQRQAGQGEEREILQAEQRQGRRERDTSSRAETARTETGRSRGGERNTSSRAETARTETGRSRGGERNTSSRAETARTETGRSRGGERNTSSRAETARTETGRSRGGERDSSSRAETARTETGRSRGGERNTSSRAETARTETGRSRGGERDSSSRAETARTETGRSRGGERNTSSRAETARTETGRSRGGERNTSSRAETGRSRG